MRWPFGPPHLTLKKQKNKKKKKKEKKKKTKENKQKTQKYPKKNNAFQLSVIFSFLGGCPKFPFFKVFDNLAKKRAPTKHYKNRGFSNPFFGKQFWVTKRPFLDNKKPNPEIPVIIFLFLPFSSLATTKNTRISWNPYFIVFLQPPKKEFSKFKLKTQNIEKPNFCTLFLKKVIFRKLPNYWTQKNTHTHTMITEQNKIAWNPYFYSAKMTLDQSITLTWTS